MKKKLMIWIILVLALASAVSALNPIIDIDLGITKDDVILFDDTYVTFGTAIDTTRDAGEYIMIISNVKGAPLFIGSYNLNFMILSDPPENADYISPIEGDYVFLNEKVDYELAMYKLEIFHNEKRIYETFLDFCNHDSSCDENENAISCKEDCAAGAKDSICINEQDDVCDPDCLPGYDPDCEEESNALLIVSIILLVCALVGVGLMKRELLKRHITGAIERFKY